jgi:hypothetical protein
MLRWIEVQRVFVAAHDIDCVAADAQTGARNDPLVDCVTDGGVGGSCAFSAHVALGSEAGKQIGLGGLLGKNGSPWDGLFDRLQVFRAWMQEEMDVCVNEAGQQSDVAEVDGFYTKRMTNRDAHFANAILNYKNLAGLEQGSRVDLEQPGSVKDDGGGRGLLRRGDDGCKKAERAD